MVGLCSGKLSISPVIVMRMPLIRDVFSAYSLIVLSLGQVSPFAIALSNRRRTVSGKTMYDIGLLSYAQGRGSGAFGLLSASAGSPD